VARRRTRSSPRGRGTRKSAVSALAGFGQSVGDWLRRGIGAPAAFLARITSGRRPELIGLILVLASLFTFLNLLTPNSGSLTQLWLGFLQVTFGWGVVLATATLLVVGLWLLTRGFETALPRLSGEQLIGWAMLLASAFVVLQAFSGAVAWTPALAEAQAGRGGGLIGALLLGSAVQALGVAGAAVMAAAWTVVGLGLALNRSLVDFVGWGLQALRWMMGRVTPAKSRPSAPSQPSAPPAPAGAKAAQRPTPQAPTKADFETEEPQAPAASPWSLPDLTAVLEAGEAGTADDAFERDRARLIEDTLKSFGAPARVIEINRGPTVTQFGVEPAFLEGRGGRRVKVKVSKIASLADDLALALAAASIRVEAPVPGKGYVGIEVPNAEVALVALRDVMQSPAFTKLTSRLKLGLGRDVSGRPAVADLAAMPHLLIAGTTGSGKSVCINAIIACLLLQNTPDEVRLVMIDPKRVELTYYNGIPHLLAPVVVDLDRVVPALQWISREMDERYRRFSKDGVRNIEDFNQRMRQLGQKTLPYLVLVVDELADLMMLAPDETERVLTRLAQLARATGIHLVIATQRPSVDVVTGLIKANFPSRIAFAVASSVDSRVILDQPGAERLLGRGDMLFQPPDAASPRRLQGVYVSEPELARLIRYWKNATLGGEDTHPSPASQPAATIPVGAPLKQAPLWEEAGQSDGDELFNDAVEVVRQMRRASISMLQRRLRIGYTRAARLIDELEAKGIVGPEPGGSQAREVLDYGELATGEDAG
jgi:DNA segregation ATPase FtsK/SpoIIIE, S-DNA-T family